MSSDNVKEAWIHKDLERFERELELDEEAMFVHLDDYMYELLDICEWATGLWKLLSYDMIEYTEELEEYLVTNEYDTSLIVIRVLQELVDDISSD